MPDEPANDQAGPLPEPDAAGTLRLVMRGSASDKSLLRRLLPPSLFSIGLHLFFLPLLMVVSVSFADQILSVSTWDGADSREQVGDHDVGEIDFDREPHMPQIEEERSVAVTIDEAGKTIGREDLSPAEAQPIQPALTNPPGVPLELRLVAKKDTYTIDLGGKTPEEFRMLLKDTEERMRAPLPPAPAIDVVLELKNTSDQEVQIWVGGDVTKLTLDLKGPGAVSILAQDRFSLDHRSPVITKLAPGKTHAITLSELSYGFRGSANSAYWSAPGEYTLSASYQSGVSPPPKDAKSLSDAYPGFAHITVTSAPIKVKVLEAKPEQQGKTDPPGVPLELTSAAK